MRILGANPIRNIVSLLCIVRILVNSMYTVAEPVVEIPSKNTSNDLGVNNDSFRLGLTI